MVILLNDNIVDGEIVLKVVFRNDWLEKLIWNEWMVNVKKMKGEIKWFRNYELW